MWRELIQSFYPAATFLPAATALQIEDDSRLCVASSLEDFLTRWLSGKLSI